MIKQHGALLAKGRFLGLQFDTLFTDTLYMSISKNAVDMAMYIKNELSSRGYEFHIDSPTNKQFVIVDDEKLKDLRASIRSYTVLFVNYNLFLQNVKQKNGDFKV